MACASLVALPRVCGSEGRVAGLNKLYIVSFADLDQISGSTEVYSASTTTGIISQINLAASKKFVEVGSLPSTAGLNEKLTKNLQNGTSFFNQTFSLTLGGLTPENKTFVESVLNQPVAILVKTRTKKFYTAGLSGELELSDLEGGTGIAEGDLIGYKLTFSGIDGNLIPQVDPAIISGLIE